jgi:taurine dioxygenase
MTYIETPPPASLLLGIEIPDQGGDTHFADQRAALAALPAALRQRVESLSVKHNAAHTSVGKLRPGFEAFDDPRDAPGAIHPMIKTHNETGKPALYLGRREWAYIPGMTVTESDDLLDALWAYVAIKENTWTQHWQPFDLIIWDNRCVMHRRDGFDQNSRRYMRRCQVLPRHAV